MSLSSLIVQREIATIREIEEALARQVLYGGDFVTNLFEVSRIEESALMPVVAESFGLPQGPTGELPKIPDDAVRLVAAEVAAERAFVPLEIGASLVIAVATPLAPDAEQELTFALALPIVQRITPLFRIRQALARDYGVPLDKRTARLITKVIHKGPRIASTFPPPLESRPGFPLPARPPSHGAPPAPPPSPAIPPVPAGVQATLLRKVEAPPARPAKRRRGPLTLDVAIAELEASAERDVIFDVLFEFARQFFDYTSLFVVHGDIAEGRDAFGDGASREKVARIGVPLDLPSLLTLGRAEKKLVRARPSLEGIDPVLMADLNRDGATECVVFPVVVRGRVVALVLGDGGLSGIDDVGVRQVEGLVESASGAFERVIMRRKLKGQDPPGGEKGVAVARRRADSAPPPPTQVSAPPTVASTHMSQRPAAEELAPPIRELMAEPVSRIAATRREPTPDAMLPADSLLVSGRGDVPPPKNLLAVRRPSGQPIPREEPDSSSPNPPQGAHVASGAPGPMRTKSGSAQRAAAPAFDFGVPQGPSVITEKRQGASDIPTTTREATADITWSREPSSPPHVHPWGQGHDDEAHSAAPYSPKALSPPPMPATPITDVSPQPIGPISTSITDRSPPSLEFVHPRPAGTPPPPPPPPPPPSAPRSASPYPTAGLTPGPGPGVRIQRPPQKLGTATLMEGMAPALPDPIEKSAPISPIVVVTPDSEMKPYPLYADDSQSSGSGSGASGSGSTSPGGDPVLALAQRKGAPPPLPPEVKPMPPSEQQVSVPAHKPPSSRSDHSRILPSVIVDTSSEYVTLVDRVLKGPDDEAETVLLRAGGYAMPAIMARFPGPIAIEPERLATPPLPRVADCGPILRLVASQRRTALPFVLSHVENPDPERRFWATYLLTELVYPDAIDPAIGRVFDPDARVRLAARTAARALAEAHPQLVVDRIGDVAKNEREPKLRRVQAIEALGEAREASAVVVLLPLLDDPSPDIANAAKGALVTIARQDFGLDASKWSAWWDANRSRHRLEWLIDALMHEQRAVRGLASDELRTITKEYFAYYDNLPKRERERAQARYREWWDTVGKVRFSRASSRGG